jgi:hypothetical protein
LPAAAVACCLCGKISVIATSRDLSFDDDQRQEAKGIFGKPFACRKRSLEGGKTHQKEIFHRICCLKGKRAIKSCVNVPQVAKFQLRFVNDYESLISHHERRTGIDVIRLKMFRK